MYDTEIANIFLAYICFFEQDAVAKTFCLYFYFNCEKFIKTMLFLRHDCIFIYHYHMVLHSWQELYVCTT